MSELITLNPTEQFLQNTNTRVTLKEVADTYNKENFNLVNDFNKMVSTLSEESFNGLNFQGVNYTDKKGEVRKTIEMDMKTLVWFISKFDHEKRYQIVNFAFEKLEESKRLAIIEAKKPNMLPNGMCSVRRAISEVWDDDTVKAPTESDIWDSLVWKGFARTEAKVTVARTIPKELNGHVGVMKAKGDVKYYPETVEKVWSEFCEAGKPVKSEYERLKEEFAEISKYYEAKLAEAKGGK
jgi:hypothetical protein